MAVVTAVLEKDGGDKFEQSCKNEVLHRVKQVNTLHTKTLREANWIGHILRGNCLLKHIIEGKTEGRLEVTVRRGRRRKQHLDDLKKTQ
jgi:hypothetical protein